MLVMKSCPHRAVDRIRKLSKMHASASVSHKGAKTEFHVRYSLWSQGTISH